MAPEAIAMVSPEAKLAVESDGFPEVDKFMIEPLLLIRRPKKTTERWSFDF